MRFRSRSAMSAFAPSGVREATRTSRCRTTVVWMCVECNGTRVAISSPIWSMLSQPSSGMSWITASLRAREGMALYAWCARSRDWGCEQVCELVEGTAAVEPLPDDCRARRGAAPRVLGPVERFAQRVGERAGVARRRSPAGDAVLDDFPQSSDRGRHDRRAARERFEDREAESFLAAGLHAHIRGDVIERQLAPRIDGIGGDHPRSDAGRLRQPLELDVAAAPVQ